MSQTRAWSSRRSSSPPPCRRPRPKDGAHPFDDGFSWPMYGYTKQRTRWLPLNVDLRPAVRPGMGADGQRAHRVPAGPLRPLAVPAQEQRRAVRRSRVSGRVRWKRKLGDLAAASPACAHGTVYSVLLARGKGIKGGRVVAVDATDGRTRWSRKIPSRVESSPLLDSGRLYFGSEDGTVYALRASDGAVRWRYRASGAVKGGLALKDGKLFFGDYGGKVQAIRQTDGTARVAGRRAPARGSACGPGGFYSTPAVAYGRVYIGSLDGFVYSFAASNGQPRVAAQDRRLRVLVARRRVGRRDRADRLHRLLRRQALRAERPVRQGPLGAQLGRQDLRRPGRHRRPRLLLEPAAAARPRPSAPAPARPCGRPAAARSTRRSPTAGGSTSSATRACSASPSAARRAATRASGCATRSSAAARATARRRAPRTGGRGSSAAAWRGASGCWRGAWRPRKRAVARNRRLRREHREVCFRSNGRTVCRVPRKLVCFTRKADDRTVCRPRKP